MYSTRNSQNKPNEDIQSPGKYRLRLSANDVSTYFPNKYIRYRSCINYLEKRKNAFLLYSGLYRHIHW